MAWEVPHQASPVSSFFAPEAYSTPRIPFGPSVRSVSPPMLPDDVPSISDECSTRSGGVSSPGNTPLKPSISSFSIVGTLGSGAHGKVLLGHLGGQSNTRELHAIKVLRRDGSNRFGVEEVKRELKTLRWITETSGSRNAGNRGIKFLQRMTESFKNDRYVFIVLEYHPVSLANPEIAARLRLKTLQPPTNLSASVSLPLAFSPSYLQRDQANSMNSLRFLAAELVLALRFLRRNGMVHQDVKPENVMVSSEGHIVLGDFGASTSLPFSMEYDDFPVSLSADTCIKKTYHPVVLQGNDIVTFTPRYAAPELLRRNDADLVVYDERVDWFSFGVLLYELATGSLPFQAEFPVHGPMSRRSVGDFSLAFGELEKLILVTNGRGSDASVSHPLGSFLKALLVHHASDRLSGEDVKLHPFFDPVSTLWDEISEMLHPPLPYPPLSSIDSDVSLSMKSGTLWDPSSSATNMTQSVDDLFEEAGLRITWPTISPSCSDDGGKVDEDRELREGDDGLASNVNSAGPSNKHIADCMRTPGREYLSSSYNDHVSNEEASEIQPFPSTASLMFLSKKGSLLRTVIPSPPEPATSLPKARSTPVVRRLIPSFYSAHDSGVDISCDADVSSSIEGDMSTNIDFVDVPTKDSISITSKRPSPSSRSSPKHEYEEAILSPTLAFDTFLFPQTPKQKRAVSYISMEVPKRSSYHSPSSSPPRSPSTATTPARRTLSQAPKHQGTITFDSVPQAQRSSMPRNRRVSAPVPPAMNAMRPTAVKRNHVRPLIPPVSRSNKVARSSSLTAGPTTSDRSRRSSLPSRSHRQSKTEGHGKRSSYAECPSAYHDFPSEFGTNGHHHHNSSSRRSSRISESWTLEEELTISVLNAMDFSQVGTVPRTRKESQFSRARRTSMSVFGSLGRRDTTCSSRGPVLPVAQAPAPGPEPVPPTPQIRKRRHSVLSKRQRPTPPSKEIQPSSPSSTPSPPSPKKSFGSFLKKLRQLSGL
ncbi:hypothetical protein V5O48_005865 [Marasmius crinis-equi]|uniref:non-specific serine/threonine protein kinase n=1 Tax=Marasmius crinis-equi TaxID=585013 RepID=A0ABR3FL46_9AGAR